MTHSNFVKKTFKNNCLANGVLHAAEPRRRPNADRVPDNEISFCHFPGSFICQTNVLLVVQVVLVHRAEVERCQSPRQGGVVLQASLGGAGENLNEFIIFLCFVKYF